MTRRYSRLAMSGMTLLFCIGIILLYHRAPGLSSGLKWLFALLPWLMLGVCLVPWPRTRPSTQAWVGMLVLLLLFAVIAGILVSFL